MAILRATQSANELGKYYWGAQSLSVSAGRLKLNGHRLQVRNILEQPVRQQKQPYLDSIKTSHKKKSDFHCLITKYSLEKKILHLFCLDVTALCEPNELNEGLFYLWDLCYMLSDVLSHDLSGNKNCCFCFTQMPMDAALWRADGCVIGRICAKTKVLALHCYPVSTCHSFKMKTFAAFLQNKMMPSIYSSLEGRYCHFLKYLFDKEKCKNCQQSIK